MKVSVITVSYNAGNTLAATLQSVRAQVGVSLEHLLIDGASTDNTLAVAREEGEHLAHIHSEPDAGLYYAMNKGLELATGEVIAFLNADDTYSHPQVLQLVCHLLESRDLPTCYGDLQVVAADVPGRVVRHWAAGAYKRSAFLRGWMPPHPSFFARRSCYTKYGGFDTRFSSSADYEIMLRLLYKEGLASAYIPEVLVQMRAGGQSNASLSNRLRANREDKLAWKVNGLRPKPYTFLAKPLRKLGQFWPGRAPDS